MLLTVDLDPVDFLWNVPTVAKRDGDFRGGQKGAVVEAFGWPDTDVTQECAFLAEAGYMGVKVRLRLQVASFKAKFQVAAGEGVGSIHQC